MGVKQKSKSLKSKGDNLADTFFQLDVLNGKEISDTKFPRFSDKVENLGFKPFKPTTMEIFQLNIGKQSHSETTYLLAWAFLSLTLPSSPLLSCHP